MGDEKKSYSNARAQASQALRQIRQYGDLSEDAWLTVQTVAIVLGINRNHVKQIAVEPVLIDKRKYYKKGEIAKWIELDAAQSTGILRRLRDQQAAAAERIAKEPSRRYSPYKLSDAERASAKSRTETGIRSPFSIDERAGGWDKKFTTTAKIGKNR